MVTDNLDLPECIKGNTFLQSRPPTQAKKQHLPHDDNNSFSRGKYPKFVHMPKIDNQTSEKKAHDNSLYKERSESKGRYTNSNASKSRTTFIYNRASMIKPTIPPIDASISERSQRSIDRFDRKEMNKHLVASYPGPLKQPTRESLRQKDHAPYHPNQKKLNCAANYADNFTSSFRQEMNDLVDYRLTNMAVSGQL